MFPSKFREGFYGTALLHSQDNSDPQLAILRTISLIQLGNFSIHTIPQLF